MRQRLAVLNIGSPAPKLGTKKTGLSSGSEVFFTSLSWLHPWFITASVLGSSDFDIFLEIQYASCVFGLALKS